MRRPVRHFPIQRHIPGAYLSLTHKDELRERHSSKHGYTADIETPEPANSISRTRSNTPSFKSGFGGLQLDRLQNQSASEDKYSQETQY